MVFLLICWLRLIRSVMSRKMADRWLVGGSWTWWGIDVFMCCWGNPTWIFCITLNTFIFLVLFCWKIWTHELKIRKRSYWKQEMFFMFFIFFRLFQECDQHYLSYINKVMSNLINSSKHWYHTARKSKLACSLCSACILWGSLWQLGYCILGVVFFIVHWKDT